MPYRDESAPPVFLPEEFEVIDRTPEPTRWERLFHIGKDGPIEYACGHQAPTRFSLKIRGEERELNDVFFTERPLCPDCLRDRSIACACCAEPIMPGESVACVVADAKWLKPRATRVGEGSVVICFRRTCAGPYPEMGGGFWNGSKVASAWTASET